ncbi:major facilitator superfamily protein [Streptomyces sparsogenes DSM 40356]|uniref:Major facilitator superfamily protein n=1 Tax=Streptomyces sparsogenes DSM 40356 TaxID=1331668 RepID=A0A1R1SAG4_9ACTN|nr:major facilitator superfamily protein [Streptomyces sparsogenes DSM 40356]
MEIVERSPGVLAPQWRLTSIGIAVSISLFAFEGLAVATAMPSAVRELRGLAFFGWSYSAFLVMNLVGLGAAGQWCDRVGPRRPLLTGIAVFTAGLLVAGTAVNMVVFVLGRSAQGIGVGLASTAVFKLVATAYPPELRPRALAIISAAYVVPALVGPVLSGTITAHVGWRWVFLGLVPLALACGGALLRALRMSAAPEGTSAGGFRKPLFALLAGGGVVVLQAGGNAVVAGRTPLTVLLLGAGLLALVAGLRELLPRGSTRLRRGVPAVIAVRGLLAGAFYAVESVVPLSLATLHGFGTAAAGLPLLAGSIGWWAGAQAQGRITKVTRPSLLRWGLVALACCFVGMAALCLEGAPGWPVYLLWIVGGLGMGVSVPTTGVLVLEQSAEDETGANSSALQISDVTAAGLGTSAAGVLVGATEAGHLGFGAGMGVLGVVAAAVCAAAAAGASRTARAGEGTAVG